MKIHEYQAREIFTRYGIPVPEGKTAKNPQEAESIAREIGGAVVVKAQVHAGGRGKAGGVKLAKDPGEAKEKAEKILGMEIKGSTVHKVLVAPAADIEKEYYLGITLDRVTSKPVLMASAAGGVDIEEVAEKTPEKILKEQIDPLLGLTAYQARRVAHALFEDGKQARVAADVLLKLYKAYEETDCSLAEINPFVLTPTGELLAIDAKINFDENAQFRHADWEGMRDPHEEDPNEVTAREAGLSFVALDGNIGCLVNGAGLAMATLDVIKQFGGDPANFLDVGGSSDPKKVVTALKVITANPKVKAILFNIFGGITRCDDIAKGILQANEQMKIDLPVVVRLTGTNEKEARELLEGTELIPAETMVDVVKKVVELAAGKPAQTTNA